MDASMPTWDAHTQPPPLVSPSNSGFMPHRYSTVTGPVAIQEGDGAWTCNDSEYPHSLIARSGSIPFFQEAQPSRADSFSGPSPTKHESLSAQPVSTIECTEPVVPFQYPAPPVADMQSTMMPQSHCMGQYGAYTPYQQTHGLGISCPPQDPSNTHWFPGPDEYRQHGGYVPARNTSIQHEPATFSQGDPPFDTTFTQPPVHGFVGDVVYENNQNVAQAWQPPPNFGSVDVNEAGRLTHSYASLIYMCLLAAPDHSRKLKDIYAWIEEYSNKASDDPGSRGWQNSVRHNLSMNKVGLSHAMIHEPILTPDRLS